ncbi:hypothetical protein Tco_1106347 [Tanacetum coccineum]
MFFSSSHSHDPQTMEDFYRPSLIGKGGPVVPTTIPGTDFALKNHMVQLLRQNCQFHGFKDEDANEHLDKALQLRRDILNFWQLPSEYVFEAWERFKSCLRRCPKHRILLVDQIQTFYYGITMIDQERFMVAAGGNFMRKTPQESYDLIENMTQHHFQWDAKLYYNTTTDMSAHYSETTFALRERVEVLGKQTGYTIQSVQHNLGPGHLNTFYYSDSDENDDDEPFEMIADQKSIHHLRGSPTLSSDPVVASLSPSLTPFEDTKNSEIDSLIKGPSDTFLMGDEDIKLNPPMDVDNLVPIPKVSEKPLDSLDPILETSKMTSTDPLFDFDSRFTLNSDNHILDIQNKESDEFKTETIMDEVQINSTQSTA